MFVLEFFVSRLQKRYSCWVTHSLLKICNKTFKQKLEYPVISRSSSLSQLFRINNNHRATFLHKLRFFFLLFLSNIRHPLQLFVSIDAQLEPLHIYQFFLNLPDLKLKVVERSRHLLQLLDMTRLELSDSFECPRNFFTAFVLPL